MNDYEIPHRRLFVALIIVVVIDVDDVADDDDVVSHLSNLLRVEVERAKTHQLVVGYA